MHVAVLIFDFIDFKKIFCSEIIDNIFMLFPLRHTVYSQTTDLSVLEPVFERLKGIGETEISWPVIRKSCLHARDYTYADSLAVLRHWLRRI